MKLVKDSVFNVKGMTCQGCVNSIRAVLGRLDGVDSVEVDLAASQVRVQHDILEADQTTLSEAIESAGYSVAKATTSDVGQASACH